MDEKSLQRLRVVTIWAAPLVLLLAFLIGPYVDDWSDEAEITRKVAESSTRALISDSLAIVYCILAILAVMAIRMTLRERSEDSWSVAAMPAVIGGFVLLAVHFGLFVARTLVIRSGTTLEQTFGNEIYTDVSGILSGLALAVGFLLLVVASRRGRLLNASEQWMVVAGVLITLVAGALDPGWADILAAVGTAAVLWPFALAIGRAPTLAASEHRTSRPPVEAGGA
jgi:hypothetical protein